MAFDGVSRVTAPDTIAPYHAYPRAAATFVVMSRALNGFYAHAQNHGRFLASNFWSWNGRAAADALGVAYFEQSTQQVLLDVQVTLPDQITKVAAMCQFRVGTNSSGVAASPTSYHHVAVTNGTYTDVGPDSVVSHPAIPFSLTPQNTVNQFYRVPFAGAVNPAMPFDDVFSVGCSVDLVNVLDTSGNVRTAQPYRLRVYGNAQNQDGSAISYAPVSVVVWWECNT